MIIESLAGLNCKVWVDDIVWSKTLGVPEVWVSNTASHFKNRAMKTLEGALRVEYGSAVANSPWLNGTCEGIMRGVVRTLKAILQIRARHSPVGGGGASGPVDSEHGLSRKIRTNTLPRHVRAGAVDKFFKFDLVDWTKRFYGGRW